MDAAIDFQKQRENSDRIRQRWSNITLGQVHGCDDWADAQNSLTSTNITGLIESRERGRRTRRRQSQTRLPSVESGLIRREIRRRSGGDPLSAGLEGGDRYA